MDQIHPKNQNLYIYPTLSNQQKYYLDELKSKKDEEQAILIIQSLNGKPKKGLMALQSVIKALNKQDRNQFFENTIPKMAKYSIELLKNSLKKELIVSEGIFQFTRKEIYQFLSLAFFGLLKNQLGRFPSPCNLTYILEERTEKVKCYLHYFMKANEEQENEIVTIERITFNQNYHIHQFFPKYQENTSLDLQQWSNCNKNLKNIEFVDQYIEEQQDSLLVDFANKYIGGGVLYSGCVQEEILFTIMPENIIAVLFCEVLKNNEVVIVKNTIRYSDYNGYHYTFQFVKRAPKNLNQNILVLDAQNYKYNPMRQYQPDEILREINKAFIGFSLQQQAEEKEFLMPISTGKWGCGAFKGDCELKTLIQLIAFSASIKREDQQRKMIFSTFKDKKMQSFKRDLDDIIQKYKNIGNLFQQLLKINKNQGLFELLLSQQ
ncbi:unnamed protein product [Paramecium sonneborni]|uniref:poly(ADP-ribose) glycohydrolase n=1 Tax=Paramecium sonneborni TaxID=65129 RepID=A0A8S1PCU3_9CILI|nr:unnamed protein product [Paramecium sonneborni]